MKRHGLTAPAKTSRARTRRLWRIVRAENAKQRVNARHKSGGGEWRRGNDRRWAPHKVAQHRRLGKRPVYAVYAVHGCSRTSTRHAVLYLLAMRDRASCGPIRALQAHRSDADVTARTPSGSAFSGRMVLSRAVRSIALRSRGAPVALTSPRPQRVNHGEKNSEKYVEIEFNSISESSSRLCGARCASAPLG